MSSPKFDGILQFRGRLYKNPTDLVNLPSPYGGTALGLVRDLEFNPNVATHVVHAEEFGTPVEIVYGGERPLFMAVLRGYDTDMLTAVFPFSVIGTVSGKAKISFQPTDFSSANRPGKLLSSQAFKLVFVPDAIDYYPCIVLYKAVPMVEEAAKLQLALKNEAGLAVSFMGIPDDSKSGLSYAIGMRKDLTL